MDGRLGHGDTANRDGPTAVVKLEEAGAGIISIAAGVSHSMVADAEGNVWTWGCALEGALGLGPDDMHTPVLLPTPIDSRALTPSERPEGADKQVRSLAAGMQTSAAVTLDGRIFAWGLGAHYALGLVRIRRAVACENTCSLARSVGPCAQRALLFSVFRQGNMETVTAPAEITTLRYGARATAGHSLSALLRSCALGWCSGRRQLRADR
jgi:hypothetical protein